MSIKVQKLIGEFPIETVVLDEVVAFDENGEAEVSEAVAEVLKEIGEETRMYKVIEEDTSEGDEPAKATPQRRAPAKK